MYMLLTFFKGLLIGIADLIPGVSGGTIALILGIYKRLLKAIQSFNFNAISLLRREGFQSFWTYIDGGFLFTLFGGIATSLFFFSKIVNYYFVQKAIPINAFFAGLVLSSIYFLYKRILQGEYKLMLLTCLSATCCFYFTFHTNFNTPETHLWIILSGVIAICAMLLPGISGGFVLLLMNKYHFMIQALHHYKISILGLFLLGCCIGMIIFSRLIYLLLEYYRNTTLAFLIGMMLGTIHKLWPWKQSSLQNSLDYLQSHDMPSFFMDKLNMYYPCFQEAFFSFLFGFFILLFILDSEEFT